MERKRNRLLILLFKITVSLTLLYLVLKKTGLHNMLSILGGIPVYYLIAGALLYILSIFISTLRWRLLLDVEAGGQRTGIGRLFSLYLIGAFFNHLLPGMIGGDAVRVYYLYRDSKAGSISAGSVFADRYFGFMALLSIGMAALPLGMGRIRGTGVEWVVPVIAVFFALTSLLMFWLRIGSRFSIIRGFYEYFLVLRRRYDIIVKTYLLSLLVQAIGILTVYMISRGLGAGTSVIEFFMFMPVILTITAIPVSISGLGIREGAFVVLLALTGIRPEMAVSISIAWFLSYAAGALPGLPLYLRWRSRG